MTAFSISASAQPSRKFNDVFEVLQGFSERGFDAGFEEIEFKDQSDVFGGDAAGAYGGDRSFDGVEIVLDVVVPGADEIEMFFRVICVGLL